MRKVTPTILVGALRRAELSGSGLKAALTVIISQVGITDPEKIMELSHMCEEQKVVDPEIQTNASRADIDRGRLSNWAKHETSLLCHYSADARHNTMLRRIFQRIETRSELDAGRHYHFSQLFLELFNDGYFKPDSLEAVCGITKDLLVQFEPIMYPDKRNGTILKQIWRKLSTPYTVTCEKYNRSGQRDPDTFPHLTHRDDTISYTQCFFRGHLSLDLSYGQSLQTRKLRQVSKTLTLVGVHSVGSTAFCGQ